MAWPRPLHDVTLSDVGSVGGKNASLGELLRELVPLGVRVPDGFAVTADAYRALMRESRAGVFVKEQLAGLSPSNVLELTQCSQRIRAAITRAPRPPRKTCQTRASPDAGQLPQRACAAFVLDAVRKAFASLFTPRAIRYRIDMGFDHEAIALSVGVQKTVRSDKARRARNRLDQSER